MAESACREPGAKFSDLLRAQAAIFDGMPAACRAALSCYEVRHPNMR